MALNPLYDPSTDNAPIAQDVQNRLNEPLQGDNTFTDEDREFLTMLLQKIEDKSINLYGPSSLLNMPVYEALPQEEKAKADQNAMVLITKIREIHSLTQFSMDATYQLKQLLDGVRLTKQRLEEHANIFVI
ncbi:MAG: hypothetical protein WC897_00685 [Candidatus Gracilibacteria bacterium]